MINSRSLWVFVGICGIIILIWFFGPLIAIADVKPLANRYVRIAVIAIIVAFYIGKLTYRILRQSRRNAVLVDEIKAAQEPILKHSAPDSALSRQFAEIDEVLRNAKFNNKGKSIVSRLKGGQYLYEMPWYVVLGPAGSGKTTALKKSGLNFPLESSFGASINGLAGTRDCDWFLADEAVLLDTAGRLSIHDGYNEKDNYDWKEFLGLLKKYRPKKPINGAIVTIGIDEILNIDKGASKNLAYELRKRVAEMETQFGISFPVYLVLTKLDTLQGFSEFFIKLTEKEREQSFGFRFPSGFGFEDQEYVVGFVSKRLTQIEESINASCLSILNELDDSSQRGSALLFANEFNMLNQKLLNLFRDLQKTSKFEKSINWRGIYFSSSKQEGAKIFSPAFLNLTKSVGVQEKYLESPSIDSKKSHSYFLHNIFKEAIFKESNLASEDKSWYAKHQFLYWLGVAAVATACLLTIILLFQSYLKNSRYLKDVVENAKEVSTLSSKIDSTDDLFLVVDFAEKVRGISKSKYLNDPLKPPLSYRMGLYQGLAIDKVTHSQYNRVLENNLMPILSYKVSDLLKNSGEADIDGYDSLKAYLMMFDSKRFDAEFMNDWILKSLDAALLDEDKRVKINNALKSIFSSQPIRSSVAFDSDLVEKKRSEIAQNDIANMILTDTFRQISRSDVSIKNISFETMGGTQSKVVFSRRSGKSISEPINSVYTKQAYMEYVLPGLIQSTAKLYKEEDWVLGRYASLKTNEVDTLRQAQRAYFERYINTWNTYLSDIQLKQPRNIREARDIAKVLSDAGNSPLKNIISGVSENTTLSLSSQISDKTPDGLDGVIDRLLIKAGVSGLVDKASKLDPAYLETIKQDSPVDVAFQDFHSMIAKKDSQSPTIDGVVISIKDLYEYLDILHLASEKGVDLPSNDSLYRYRSEISRLPSPFREMFDQFSNFILNKSLDEMNDRLQKSKEEAEAAKLREKAELEAEALKQEEKIKLQSEEQKKQEDSQLQASLTAQLNAVSRECESLIQKYPFAKSAKNDASLNEFSNIFSASSGYGGLLRLKPEDARLAGTDSLITLVNRGGEYEKFAGVKNSQDITRTYFKNSDGNLGFDFSAKIDQLDKTIDTVILSFEQKKLTYSHGPVNATYFNWPHTKDKTASLILIADGKEVGSIKKQGEWALFKLVDAGDITKTREGIQVSYAIKDKKVTVTYETSGKNPLDLNMIRSFSCPTIA